MQTTLIWFVFFSFTHLSLSQVILNTSHFLRAGNANQNFTNNNLVDHSADNSQYLTHFHLVNNLIIVVGLPKSGTTSVHEGFHKLQIRAAHWSTPWLDQKICQTPSFYPIPEVKVGGNSTQAVTWSKIDIPIQPKGCFVGVLIQKAMSQGLKPLEYLTNDTIQAFSQMDVSDPASGLSIWPQIDALESLTTAYPHAYYIHTRRVTDTSHVASIAAWNHMLDRFQLQGFLSRYPGQSPNNTQFENGLIMVREIRKHTFEFFNQRPHLKFLSITIEDKDASNQLAHFLNVPTFPLEQHNKGTYDSSHSAAPSPSHILHDDSQGNTQGNIKRFVPQPTSFLQSSSITSKNPPSLYPSPSSSLISKSSSPLDYPTNIPHKSSSSSSSSPALSFMNHPHSHSHSHVPHHSSQTYPIHNHASPRR